MNSEPSTPLFERSPTARVVMVADDLVTIEALEVEGRRAPLVKNEVVYVRPSKTLAGDSSEEWLKAEVLRIRGHHADAQVFEDTRGVAVDDPVIQSGEMLSIALGPGLLGMVYDGLQNPLERLAGDHGTFLPRGIDLPALEVRQKWAFVPEVRAGARLRPGDLIGKVPEGRFQHRIMIPFGLAGEVEVTWIQAGNFTVDTVVARFRDSEGAEHPVTLWQVWPVRRPLPERLLKSGINQRLYPEEPLITTQRLIDTFFPIARGGTGCIPGPFGAGKTVLQGLIARHSDVDIVIIVACGERAGEVVETIAEFPKLKDPHTGGTLMERTIIICNTSSMPVAAREASIYTGITLGEYYRQMGLNVLLLADSTSRWAQAMRETSGRMEEIPGEEAFPAYLDSAVRGVYERAGVIRNGEGRVGSLTLIGTVSPAGGNFEEPVTQSTLGTVKTFLGLSYDRAYKRYYPAIDPLISWSRYRQQLAGWFSEHLTSAWSEQVVRMERLLHDGESVSQMMQVTGEEGVTLEDFVLYQKAHFLDRVYLQQDAFDAVDASTLLARQQATLTLVDTLCNTTYQFVDKEQARSYFTRLTGLFINLNYSRENSPDYKGFKEQIEILLEGAQKPGGAG